MKPSNRLRQAAFYPACGGLAANRRPAGLGGKGRVSMVNPGHRALVDVRSPLCGHQKQRRVRQIQLAKDAAARLPVAAALGEAALGQ